MTDPRFSGGHDLGRRIVSSAPGSDASSRTGRSRAVVVLAILSALLLVTTICFGATALVLWNRDAAAPSPSASPSTTQNQHLDADGASIHGIPLQISSQLTFVDVAMENAVPDAYTLLYAVIENPSSDQAVTAFFDVTAYSADGAVIDRTPTDAYLLPGQQTVVTAIFSGDLTSAERIVIEEITHESGLPAFTGDVAVTGEISVDQAHVRAAFTSSLSAVAEYAEIYFVGVYEDEIFAVCTAFVDIPANASFTADCGLDPVWTSAERDIDAAMDEATFTAYAAYDIPW